MMRVHSRDGGMAASSSRVTSRVREGKTARHHRSKHQAKDHVVSELDTRGACMEPSGNGETILVFCVPPCYGAILGRGHA